MDQPGGFWISRPFWGKATGSPPRTGSSRTPGISVLKARYMSWASRLRSPGAMTERDSRSETSARIFQQGPTAQRLDRLGNRWLKGSHELVAVNRGCTDATRDESIDEPGERALLLRGHAERSTRCCHSPKACGSRMLRSPSLAWGDTPAASAIRRRVRGVPSKPPGR